MLKACVNSKGMTKEIKRLSSRDFLKINSDRTDWEYSPKILPSGPTLNCQGISLSKSRKTYSEVQNKIWEICTRVVLWSLESSTLNNSSVQKPLFSFSKGYNCLYLTAKSRCKNKGKGLHWLYPAVQSGPWASCLCLHIPLGRSHPWAATRWLLALLYQRNLTGWYETQSGHHPWASQPTSDRNYKCKWHWSINRTSLFTCK